METSAPEAVPPAVPQVDVAEVNAARVGSTPAGATSITAKMIERRWLFESATNPRKRWGDLDELGKSIAAAGILEPLIVRPDPGGELFEIVCGARRFRAGSQVGVNEFPCVVRELSDDHVREFQIVENLQRKNLHPMEEAEGFEVMMRKREDGGLGYDAETIAVRVGKTSGWVYARLKLLNLTPEARGAFFSEQIEPSVAIVLGRQPQSSQGRALIGLAKLATVKEQIAYLQRDFARNLKGAPFDLKDGTMPKIGGVEGVGDCAGCEQNSNNAPRDLFADFESIDRAGICANPECFLGKCAATTAAKLEAAKAKGATVLSPAEARKVLILGSSTSGSPYVKADDLIADDPKHRTWGQAVRTLEKEERPALVLAPDDQNPGRTVELYDRKAAVKAALDAGITSAKRQAPAAPLSDAAKAKRKASDDRARVIAETVEHALPKLVAAFEEGADLTSLRPAALAVLEHGPATPEQVEVLFRTFALKGDPKDAPALFEKWIGTTATADRLSAFILAGLLFPRWQDGLDELNPELKKCAKSADVDLAEIGRAQLAAAKSLGAVKWSDMEDGISEATINGERYEISFNGGDGHGGYLLKGPKFKASATTEAEGRAACLHHAGKLPGDRVVKPVKK